MYGHKQTIADYVIALSTQIEAYLNAIDLFPVRTWLDLDK